MASSLGRANKLSVVLTVLKDNAARLFAVVSAAVMVMGGIANATPARGAETGHSANASAADPPVLYFQHSFYPESGVVGTPVTISGLNLTSTIGVKFNNTPASFTVTPGQPGSPDSSILTTVPAGARSGPITVTTPGGTTTTQNSFTVNPPPPTFTR